MMQALPVLGAGPDLLRTCCGCPCRGLLPGALGGGLRAEGLRRSPGVAPAAGAPGKIGGPCCCRCPAAADAGGAGLLAGADDLRAGADGPDLGPVPVSRCWRSLEDRRASAARGPDLLRALLLVSVREKNSSPVHFPLDILCRYDL